MAVPSELISELLRLPEAARAELAEVLLESLDPADAPLTADQEAELAASIAEADRGELISAADVLRELRDMAGAQTAR